MKLNQRFLDKLANSLFSEEHQREQLKQALLEGNGSKQAIVWLTEEKADLPALQTEKQSFFPFVDIVRKDANPGSDPLHEAGSIYCLDHSSVFSLAVMHHINIEVDTILDACAAPGGKSILAWRFFKPGLLVANETIGKRVKMLISNLKRCKIAPSAVASLDTRVLAEKFPLAFDLVIVDAPCSGQSLLAKGESSPGCLNPAVVNKNANRQKRILANAALCCAPEGYLIYSTCTFSQQENEKVIQWFQKKYPYMEPQPVELLEAYQSPYAPIPCYRLFPFDGLGAGAFTVLFKNTVPESRTRSDISNEKYIWKFGW